MTRRVVLHADMDAFYASVEQRDHPELRGKPVIIGAQSARGVVAAASYEARRYGVRSAMPGFRARQLCPKGIFLGGDMQKYASVSRQVHAIFADFTDCIEPLALDEAFLDISGSLHLFGGELALARSLKERVRAELNLIVSVGVAPNKLVAKIACTRGKPDGLMVVAEQEIPALLYPLPVRALFGVGPKTEQQLKSLGIATVADIATCPLARLRPVFGTHAQAMKDRAQGRDDRPVISDGVPKSIGEEATFPEDVTDRARITSAILSHSDMVAARARRAGYVGQTVTVKVKLARRRAALPPGSYEPAASHELFPVLSRQRRLPSACADGNAIGELAIALFNQLAVREPIRLVGVSLSHLAPGDAPRQLELFAQKTTPSTLRGTSQPRAELLGRTLDAISDRFGEGAIFRAGQRVEKLTHTDKIKIGAASPGDDE